MFYFFLQISHYFSISIKSGSSSFIPSLFQFCRLNSLSLLNNFRLSQNCCFSVQNFLLLYIFCFVCWEVDTMCCTLLPSHWYMDTCWFGWQTGGTGGGAAQWTRRYVLTGGHESSDSLGTRPFATLNQRHWRWFNLAKTSCVPWVGSTLWTARGVYLHYVRGQCSRKTVTPCGSRRNAQQGTRPAATSSPHPSQWHRAGLGATIKRACRDPWSWDSHTEQWHRIPLRRLPSASLFEFSDLTLTARGSTLDVRIWRL